MLDGWIMDGSNGSTTTRPLATSARRSRSDSNIAAGYRIPDSAISQSGGIIGSISGMREQGLAGNDLQGRFIRRAQQDGGREAGLVGLQPPARAHAPAIPRLESREPELRSWRAQVVPDGTLMLKEFCGHHRADGVRAEIIRAGRAAAIAVEARQGCPRASG